MKLWDVLQASFYFESFWFVVVVLCGWRALLMLLCNRSQRALVMLFTAMGVSLRGSVGGIAKPVPSATWFFLSRCCYCDNAITGLCVCPYGVPTSNIWKQWPSRRLCSDVQRSLAWPHGRRGSQGPGHAEGTGLLPATSLPSLWKPFSFSWERRHFPTI